MNLLVKENSYISNNLKGRLFVSVTKATPDIWVYLLKDNEKLPGMRIWWEMKDTYKDAMRKYDKLLEKEEDGNSKVMALKI